jgi:cyclic pyranopterin phosphate synthase
MRLGASDAELRERIAAVWRLRQDRYSEERAARTDLGGRVRSDAKLEMYQLGG